MATSHVDIGAYKARFNGRMSTFKRGVLLKLFGAVIKDTPVLTGRLRGNWQFGKTSLPSQGPQDSSQDPTTVISAAILTQVGNEDTSYFLVNTMPYCNRIEYQGWSRVKAPDGMVRKNLIRIKNILQQQAALNRGKS